jgi:antitoxin component YwqK of YwqJK toxin-antitoxin module
MEQKQYYDENKAEVNISNNDPSLNGPYITYYENGQLKVLGLYQNNEADSS